MVNNRSSTSTGTGSFIQSPPCGDSFYADNSSNPSLGVSTSASSNWKNDKENRNSVSGVSTSFLPQGRQLKVLDSYMHVRTICRNWSTLPALFCGKTREPFTGSPRFPLFSVVSRVYHLPEVHVSRSLWYIDACTICRKSMFPALLGGKRVYRLIKSKFPPLF